MIRTENTIIINAPGDKVFSVVSDFEAWPQFIPAYQEVKIVKKEDNRLVIERKGEVRGKPVFWKSEVKLEPPASIKSKQVEGPIPDMEIEWCLEETEGGTRIILSHNFEYKKIPLLGYIIGRLIVAKIVYKMADETLQAIKNRVENQV
ncbi:MAG: SRPBCC family protein [bacterium]